MITGGTKLLCVIGHPIAHSLSPQIHNRFAQSLGLDYAYLAFDVIPETLEEFLRAARALPIAGLNATMPLKEHLTGYLDEADAEVRRCGACNTVANREGRLCGTNSDGDGFLLSLRRRGIAAEGTRALILGAGGAAKAVAAALVHAGADVRIACRRPEAAERVPGVAYLRWEEIGAAAGECGLLINATPLGMHGVQSDFEDLSFLSAMKPGSTAYDLIYAPRETAFLREARQRGLGTMNGLAHLVCQAAISFAFFTGVKPEDGVIDELIREL